jgi:hypothetical protein
MSLKRWLPLLLLFILPSCAWAQGFETISLDPPNTIAGATDFLLSIHGSGFVLGATINWNGAPLSTNFISQGQLTATINTFRVASIGAGQVSVTQSGITSPALTFQILTPMVGVRSYQPTTFTAGVTTGVTVYGQGFNPNATIFFDWFPVVTSFIDSGTLTGSIDGSNIIGNGPHHVFVYNATVPPGLASLRMQALIGFGNQTVGTTTTQTITITNTSASTVILAGPYRVISGTNASDFAAVGGGTCANGLSILAGASCTASFTFTPSVLDDEIAAVSINSNGIGTPQFISLSGSGVPVLAPAVSITPTTLSFGNQVSTTTSSLRTVTLVNSGNDNLTLTSVTLGGTNSADFTLSGSCAAGTLVPQQSCTISATFTPSTTATESASVSVVDSAVGSPHVLALTGTGIVAPAHFVTLAWNPSVSSNLIGYNVYRGTTNGGPYSLLTPSPIDGTAYTDSTVTHGTTYYYVVTAVGTNPPYSPAESLNSNQSSTTP